MPLSRYYNNYISSWNFIREKGLPLANGVDQSFKNFVSSHCQENNSNIFLDYGCGIGQHISYLREKSIKAIGCDISNVGIDPSHNFDKDKKDKRDEWFQSCDGMHIPFDNNFFSHAYSINCIDSMSWENANAIIPEIYRVLDSKAFFYLDLASNCHLEKDPMSFKESKEFEILNNTFIQVCYFSELKISRLLDPLFRIISCKIEPGHDLYTNSKINRWHVICQKN